MELKTTMRPPESANELIKLCRYIKERITPEVIVEIGSYSGESSVIFAREFPNSIIYCIDPWEGGYADDDGASSADYSEVEAEFDLRVKNYPNIIKIKGYSSDHNIKCDLVYIDGCHKYECVKSDIIQYLKLSKCISGHDYYDDQIDKIQPHTAGVRKAVNEILGIPDKTFADGSWIKLFYTPV
jgi:hypothetical protein